MNRVNINLKEKLITIKVMNRERKYPLINVKESKGTRIFSNAKVGVEIRTKIGDYIAKFGNKLRYCVYCYFMRTFNKRNKRTS